MQEIDLIPHFFLEILHFKQPCNLIGQEHFVHNLKTRFLLDKRFAVRNTNN